MEDKSFVFEDTKKDRSKYWMNTSGYIEVQNNKVNNELGLVLSNNVKQCPNLIGNWN